MAQSASRFKAYSILALAGLLGYTSLPGFIIFLFAGPFCAVNLGWGDTAALFLNVGLCLAFFIQHSAMIRRSFRRWSARFFPEEYHGVIYTIASGIVLLALIVFWQESTTKLVAPEGILRWSLRAIFILSVAGVAWGMRALEFSDSFGFKPVLNRLRGTKPPPSSTLIVRGPYRWVRHPLYLFFLVMMWSYPDLTLDRLLFNVLFTGWMIIGSILEERDLVDAFGEAYRDYQRKVPMLLPYRIWPSR